jgi:SAM-dependent methyltransferase
LLKHLIPRRFRRPPEKSEEERRRDEALQHYEWAMLNIKTLGYELAKHLTRGTVSPPPGLPQSQGPQSQGLRSKLCTQADIESPWFAYWCAEGGISPVYLRKIWEFSFVAQALYDAGVLTSGRAGIAFGCGQEPLPSLFAKYGCDILATDLRPGDPRAERWGGADQTAGRLAQLRQPDLCADPERLAAIGFRWVDMNDIPEDLSRKFDFCWSSCAMEHLGGLAQGARFVEESLQVLKPGGVAVHTTEFNMAEAGQTLDTAGLALFQRRHIEGLADRLRAAGHNVAAPDFAAGEGFLDRFVDLPPWHSAMYPDPEFHLKVSLAGYRCTSFGLIVRRAA